MHDQLGIGIGEFELKYTCKYVTKGHVLADFVVECTILQQEEDEPSKTCNSLHWTIHVDGATNGTGGGGGIILELPKGLITEHTLHFGFNASNNAAGYEVVLVGLDLVGSTRAKKINIKSNSALVVREFEARDENMKLYQEEHMQRLADLDEVQFYQILIT